MLDLGPEYVGTLAVVRYANACPIVVGNGPLPGHYILYAVLSLISSMLSGISCTLVYVHLECGSTLNLGLSTGPGGVVHIGT